MPLRLLHNAVEYTNFNQININFNVNGYTKTEQIFFPNAETEHASLAFTDSGYKRFPYSIAKNNK